VRCICIIDFVMGKYNVIVKKCILDLIFGLSRYLYYGFCIINNINIKKNY